jgi:hypothetical protein
VACCLIWLLFHFDIHNAFQSTLDDGDINRNCSWLQINNTWIDYIQDCKPKWYPKVATLLETHDITGLAAEM